MVLDDQGRRDLQEWSFLNRHNYTMLVAWDKFNTHELKTIAKWLSESGVSVTMGSLPFVPIRALWGVIWRAEANMRRNMPDQRVEPCTVRFRVKLMEAVQQQAKADEAKKNENTG